jgi:S1-C subfamily serine protease
MRFARVPALLGALLLLGGLLRADPAAALERAQRERALHATVQVIVPDNRGNLISGGSGTVIDAGAGYILTNYHVMGEREAGTLYNDEGLAVIGINPANLRGVPVFKYTARVVGADPEIDLAVLQIFGLFDDAGAALPRNLGLTDVERGQSAGLMIGDPIYVLGFPGLGGDTVTYTEGAVSGYLDEDRDGVEEWIKTDAEINHGNSGGLAVDEAGDFIGVPTAGYSDAESAGKISLIRPGDLALQYFDAWTLGQPAPAAAGGAQVVKVEFGTGVSRTGAIRNPAARFDAGITDLYASFEVAGFRNGQQLTYTWYYDGAEQGGESYEWVRGERGRDWVSITNGAGLADGLYELELALGGRVLYRGGAVVGEQQAAPRAGALGPITFAAGVEEDGTPVGAATEFANVGEVFAIFPGAGLADGVLLKSAWSFEGDVVLEDEAPWTGGPTEVAWTSITHESGLPVGRYTLELFLDGTQVQSGGFTVSENARAGGADVNVAGVVSDADSARRKVADALVIFLLPGVSVEEFVAAEFDEGLIHGMATTNRSGEYQLDARVTPGESYGIVVVHDAYAPLQADAYQIPPDAPDPYLLDISLERR